MISIGHVLILSEGCVVVLKGKTLKISAIIAAVILPVIIIFLFLQSVWNPFGNTNKLPIAVVNNDEAVNYQGKQMAVGQQMVDKLKDNDGLDWHFVSEKQAKKGLADNKYYTVVTIPKNFSKRATTVTNAKPKAMQLHYTTNDSMNYIAKIMSEVGLGQVNSQIRSAVTKTYALTMFDQIHTAGKGFSDAAKGVTQAKDGTVTLADGLKTYTTGVHTLHDGTTELKTSVSALPDGIQKLTDGAKTLDGGLNQLNSKTPALASGVNKLADGSGQVSDGLKTLDSKTGDLANGVVKLKNGAKAELAGVVTYTNGVYQVNLGLKQLSGKSGALVDGINQLSDGATTLDSGVTDYTNAVSQLGEGISTLQDSTKDMPSSVSQLAAGGSQLNDGVRQLADTLKKSTSSISSSVLMSKYASLSTAIKQLTTDVQALSTSSATTTTKSDSSSQDNGGMTQSQIDAKIDEVASSQDMNSDQKAAMKSALAGAGTSGSGTGSSDTTTMTTGTSNSAAAITQSRMIWKRFRVRLVTTRRLTVR